MSGTEIERLRLEIHGAVQGVGFRPFVYRLAHDLQVTGWVRNDPHGVFIEVEGRRNTLESFLHRLPVERPPHAVLHTLEPTWLDAQGYETFSILESRVAAHPTAVVLPDLATCSACRAELFDPADRRHRYPFINCTHCGPRFSIVRQLPYDRPSTTMRDFALCRECRMEYEDPLDRRFHAQPNACPRCGPRIALWNRQGETLARNDAALRAAASAVRGGKILALKGLGGFHLMVDARDPQAIAELRRRKGRDAKPFAVMVRDLATARRHCGVGAEAERVLTSPEAPIVLLSRHPAADVAEPIASEVAPGNPYLGLMLPSTPLHHLLLAELDFPVVATSGNRSDEPIAIDNLEALDRLGHIADGFLVHDRPIARHVDDSVVFVTAGAPRLIRRARGYAPLPVRVSERMPTLLAMGGHLKNTVALSVGSNVFLSQHLGDMDTPESLTACERVVRDFLELYEAKPVAVVHDLHPDYASTRLASEWASRLAGHEPREIRRNPWEQLLTGQARPRMKSDEGGLPTIAVQHHHAHLASCLADSDEPGPALGVIWDGTGYGPDGTVWGGEFLLGTALSYERVAHLAPFRLPGGEAAVVEPRRVALALLWEMEGEAALEQDLPSLAAFAPPEKRLLAQMLARGFHAPVTTSVGRLFDAVASLLGLRHKRTFEGQAAMAVEHIADLAETGSYPLDVNPDDDGVLRLDWRPLIGALLEELRRGVEPGVMAARFHNALIEGAVEVARRVGEGRVALSGGCFQNRLLLERTARRLGEEGFRVLLHQRVPANDGGLSLGQVAVVAARLTD